MLRSLAIVFFFDGFRFRCDEENNHESCEWDGGDCCEESCVDGSYTCGVGTGNVFDCQDPDPSIAAQPSAAPTERTYHPTTSMIDVANYTYYYAYDDCKLEFIGDGWCVLLVR